MAATEYWISAVDYTDAGDGLTFGTAMRAATGDPLQRLLDSGVTLNATDGNIIHVIADGTYTPAAELDFTAFGTPVTTAPLVLKGMHSDGTTASDLATGVGIPTFDFSDGAYVYIDEQTVFLRHLDFTNASTNPVYVNSCSVINCSFSDCGTYGLRLKNYSTAIGCFVDNCGTYGIYASATGSTIINCHGRSLSGQSRTDSTNVFLNSGSSGGIVNSTASITGSSSGMYVASGGKLMRNSIFADSGTGSGIGLPSTAYGAVVVDNIVEGFSGAGGKGVDYGTNASPLGLIGNNAIYNCSTYTDGSPDLAAVRLPDFTLTETPFSKLGADTFANRANYFAPRSNVGASYL